MKFSATAIVLAIFPALSLAGSDVSVTAGVGANGLSRLHTTMVAPPLPPATTYTPPLPPLADIAQAIYGQITTPPYPSFFVNVQFNWTTNDSGTTEFMTATSMDVNGTHHWSNAIIVNPGDVLDFDLYGESCNAVGGYCAKWNATIADLTTGQEDGVQAEDVEGVPTTGMSGFVLEVGNAFGHCSYEPGPPIAYNEKAYDLNGALYAPSWTVDTSGLSGFPCPNPAFAITAPALGTKRMTLSYDQLRP